MDADEIAKVERERVIAVAEALARGIMWQDHGFIARAFVRDLKKHLESPRCSHGAFLYDDDGAYTKPECGCPGDAHLPEMSDRL